MKNSGSEGKAQISAQILNSYFYFFSPFTGSFENVNSSLSAVQRGRAGKGERVTPLGREMGGKVQVNKS